MAVPQVFASDGDAGLIKLARKNMAHNTRGARHPVQVMQLAWRDGAAARNLIGSSRGTVAVGVMPLSGDHPPQARDHPDAQSACDPHVTGVAAALLPSEQVEHGQYDDPAGTPPDTADTASDHVCGSSPGVSGRGSRGAPLVPDVVMVSDCVYGSNPGVWEGLVCCLAELAAAPGALVLQAETFRLEGRCE